MVESNCQLFLNQYLKNDTKLRYSQENKNALLILDTRPSLNLILVIRNALDKIKKVNLIVVGNKEVFDLVDQHIGKEYLKIRFHCSSSMVRINLRKYIHTINIRYKHNKYTIYTQ